MSIRKRKIRTPKKCKKIVKNNKRAAPRSKAKKPNKSKRRTKKTKKRDVANFPGLKKHLFSRIKQEYHDIDYIDQLSEKEKMWLSQFMEEDLGARFNHDGKKIYRKDADKKASYRRNNQRNRDWYSLIRATGQFDNEEISKQRLDDMQNLDTTNPEDSIIDAIDGLKELKKPELIEE